MRDAASKRAPAPQESQSANEAEHGSLLAGASPSAASVDRRRINGTVITNVIQHDKCFERGSVTQKVARLDSVACLDGSDLVGPAEHGSSLGEVHDDVSVPVEDVADLADASTLGEAAVNVVDAPRRTGHVGRLIDPLIDGHTHILPNPISWIRLGDLVCRHFRGKVPAQTFNLTEIVDSDPRKVLSREVDRQRRGGSPFSDASVLLRELMAEPLSSTGITVSVGSGTVYVDVRIPFTRRVICVDIGRHRSLGWRYKR